MTTRNKALVAGLLLMLLGCTKEKDAKPKPADLGEPVGADVPAAGATPGFSIALAVSKGQDPAALLPKLVGVVASSVKSCPTFASEQKDEVCAFPFQVEGGKLKVTGLPDDSAGTKCMVAGLDGKEVLGAQPGVLDGRLEMKIGKGAK